ncbi:MAG TPA: hypothetical protein VEA61_03055, partial [Allosphingosinicella sp.]|nr:hypothetical protein [Allosphingosinicella sp.]
MNGFDLEPQWMWLLGAIALGIAELIVPGVFLIWLAALRIARVAADPAPVPAGADPGGWRGLAYFRL